jgi:RHS repeat-associated protein
LVAINDSVNGFHFSAFDGNGNVVTLVKAADGTISAQYEYGPFGEVIRATGPMAKANPFRFSTRFDDDETDFLYYGYRYYNPSTGRWISRDPMEEQGGLNVYGVAANDAVDEYDSLGLCGCSVTSATLQSSRVIADADGFHWNVIGDVQFADRTGCVPIQWQKTTAWENGQRITKAGEGLGPINGIWHIDSSPYNGDTPPSGDIGHSTGGVDILINSDSELRYHDRPGWHGLKRRDIYSLHVNLKIVVYDANSKPPYRVVKESNILDLSQAGVWPNIGIVIPK